MKELTTSNPQDIHEKLVKWDQSEKQLPQSWQTISKSKKEKHALTNQSTNGTHRHIATFPFFKESLAGFQGICRIFRVGNIKKCVAILRKVVHEECIVKRGAVSNVRH